MTSALRFPFDVALVFGCCAFEVDTEAMTSQQQSAHA